VTVCQQCRQKAFHDMVLSDHDACNLLLQARPRSRQSLQQNNVFIPRLPHCRGFHPLLVFPLSHEPIRAPLQPAGIAE
jgi:hypothetical protein